MYNFTIPRAFETLVDQYEDKQALRFESGESHTYGSLNTQANQLAHHLIELGVKSRDVICISGDKTPLTYALIFACLKIGAPYAVLDPESPISRLEKIISNCAPHLVFADDKLTENLGQHFSQFSDQRSNIRFQSFSLVATQSAGLSTENLMACSQLTGNTPAYIMYTSGSTGFPKGAVMTHANVLNFAAWGKEEFGVEVDDVFTNVNPLYFDNSVYDLYVSLLNGATLAPFSKALVSQPKLLVEAIDKIECTAWFSVPSLLMFLMSSKVLTKDTFRSLRRFVFGGEGYPKSQLKKLYDLYHDHATLFNVYGPTECTCMCSSYVISEEDFEDLHGFPPLGSIINNFDFHIVDDANQCIANGEAGELCLLGPNVGMGYFNDPERTARAFAQTPTHDSYREVMYKTGDLVRYNSEDNKIYILGRVDNQVKHMGYRIELEEIENGLCTLDYVHQAAVVHGERRGLSQLLAVVQVKQEVEKRIVREDLKNVLPHYMIPTEFLVSTDEIVKNQNGKIDRKRIAHEHFGGN